MIHRLDQGLRRFGRAKEGNIAVTFAIALLPLLAFIGAAVDYSRANAARYSMQAALDSAALMVAKDLSSGVISTSQVSTTATNYFTALYTSKEAEAVTVAASYNAVNGSLGSTVQLNAAADIRTDFMYMFGFPTMGFSATTTTAWGNARLRVAMALDNTGSMAQDGKLPAMQSAATGSGGLIDQLSALSKTDGDVYISLIPFAKVVNVNKTNSGASWIDWTDWMNPPTAQPANGSVQATLPKNWHAVGPGSKCPWTISSNGFACTSGPANGSSTVSTIPTSGSNPGYICPSGDHNTSAFYNGCWTSEPTGLSEVFCSGSSQCACPKDSSNNSVSGCSCTGSGSGKSCTGLTYVHNWTQPGSTAPVGFPSHKWTATNSTPTIANAYTGTSTNPTSTWTGCVIDRTQPNDATDMQPTSDVTTKFPANQWWDTTSSNGNPLTNTWCDPNASTKLTPVIPLTTSWSTLKTAINAMQPTGNTNQAIALSVAAQTLIPGGAMFNGPAEDPNYTYNRAIILLSDGLNTADRWHDYAASDIDARQALLCQNLKAIDPTTHRPKYIIYTVQVNTSSPADPTSTVLQNCASSPDKFFMLTSASQIVSAFKSIGTSLSQLRVAR
jgi:Flp pilus assembly protein TadG